EAVQFSQKLLAASADLGAAFGQDTAQVIADIGSGLRGESDPLEKYGIFLQETEVRDAALRAGLIKTKNEALDPRAKILAANNIILEKAAQFEGTFAREATGAAGAAKIATAEMENAQTSIGEGLTPIMAGAAKTVSFLVEQLNRIPGATKVIGGGLALLGGAAIVGGGITSILGAVKAVQEFRNRSAEAGA